MDQPSLPVLINEQIKKIIYSLVATFFVPLLSSGEEVKLADPTIFEHDGIYYLCGTEAPPQVGFQIRTSSNLKHWSVLVTAYGDEYILKKDSHTFGTKGFWAPQFF